MVSVGQIYDETKRIFFELISEPNFYVFILLICFLIYTAYRIYYKSYAEPKLNNYKANSEYIKDTSDDANLYLFYTTWCPHSKNAMEVMKAFEDEHKSFNGTTINYFYIDAEAQESMAEEYGVESYPSVYLVHHGNRVYFDANVKKPLLKKFLETSL